jgi:hypothetical protein
MESATGRQARLWIPSKKVRSKCAVKKETHAARWGLLRGYSGTATKWVDFVVIGSTRREPDHFLRVEPFPRAVKRFRVEK